MTRYFLLIASFLIVTSCGGELGSLDPEPECIKTWTVEINNPEATVKIENGMLIVHIENPKSAKDVRLIQVQDADKSNGEIGVGVDLRVYEVVPVNERATDSHIKASFAYAQNPDQPFLSKVRGSYGSRGYSMGEEIYTNFASNDNFSFYAKGTQVKFNDERAPNALQEIPLVSSAKKIFYLDFGVNSTFTKGNPTKSIHAEINLIAFGDHTSGGMQLVSGYNPVQYGFRVDEFFCNTLK